MNAHNSKPWSGKGDIIAIGGVRWFVLLWLLFFVGPPNAACSQQPDTHPLVGIYAGLDANTLEMAEKSGVDIVYPSITWYEPQTWVKAAVELAHKHGLKVYPSVAAAYDGYGDTPSAFAQEHPEYWEKRKDGTLLDKGEQVNMSWGYPEVRKYKVDAITKFIFDGGFDGILLDYTRFFGNDSGYSDIIVQEFKKKFNRDPSTLARDDLQWLSFRADYVTRFVGELSISLKTVDKNLKLLACVGPDPCECLLNSMNNWKDWLDKGYIDGVVTMIYERDTNNTIRNIAIANRAIAGRVPHIPMIACWGGNLNTPEMLKEGSVKCLKSGCFGVAFYRSDVFVQLKLWPAIAEIAHWTKSYIDSQKINYILNSGFENGDEYYAFGYGRGVELAQQNANAGKMSLKLDPSCHPAVRQLIDRGFLRDKNALHISLQYQPAKCEQLPELTLEANINYKDGRERFYRMPAPVAQSTCWQKFDVDLHLGSSNDLNFIILSVEADGLPGSLYIDDIELNLSDANVQPEQFLSAPEPIVNTAGINIARGQLTSASSFWENGFEPANAVDGDLSSSDYGKGAAWHSQRPPRDQWLKIYLPRTHIISKVRMLNSSAMFCYRTKDFRIEISTDDKSYRSIASGALPDDGETWTEIEVPKVPAKYIKFIGLNSFHPEYSVGLKEIELY